MARATELATAMPELVVASRSDNKEVERWSVEGGSSNRGDAFTDFDKRIVRIPLATDEVSRVVRGHELIHIKVSPTDVEALNELMRVWTTTWRVMECAEEFRVNTLLGRVGYDLSLLTDGSEATSGQQSGKQSLTSPEAYNEAICFGVAITGTPVFRKYINGVRKHNPELAKVMRKLELSLLKVMRGAGKELASTELSDAYTFRSTRDGKSVQFVATAKTVEGVDIRIGLGYGRYVAELVALIEMSLKSVVSNKDIHQSTGRAGVDYEVGSKSGEFAPLILDETVICNQQVKGHLGRRKKPSTTGRALRYPERLLTDPQRRIFATKQKSSGGIVLIDQSGSMDLSESDLEKLLDLSPSALVIGYSHRPRSRGEANAWVIANRGMRVATGEIPEGKIGNGVDGPVLDYAISQRRASEPIIWVFDGQATDANDNPSAVLSNAVAQMVKRHRVVVAPSMDDAITALSAGRNARSTYNGRLKTAMALLEGKG
jgi:hypothetical protein